MEQMISAAPSPQSEFGVRFGWGRRALRVLAPGAGVVVVVDVLSFTTCVDVATSRGAVVLPFAGISTEAARYADRQAAELAGGRGDAATTWSLSPASLLSIPPGTRLVLPSSNGSALAWDAAEMGVAVFAGCLRNASAVAAAVSRFDPPVVVIAAGERADGGSLRLAVEDLLGAGAIIARLDGTLSPEAEAAAEAFRDDQGVLVDRIQVSASGHELIAAGFSEDVEIASARDASDSVPLLEGAAFIDRPSGAL